MTETETTNEYMFSVAGTFDVDKTLRVDRDYMGNASVFVLPDGRRVDLVIGLRIQHPDGTEEFTTKETDFAALGLHACDYGEAHFDNVNIGEENPEFKEDWEG